MATSTELRAADGQLLRTKFHIPPLRRTQVARPRLVDRLARGAEGKLTVISAPPGFGKTSLLSEWLGGRRDGLSGVAWVSLDPADDQPGNFWRYVFEALTTAVPGLEGSGVLQAVSQPQLPAIETVLTIALNVLLNERAAVTLVLDDYHVITKGAIHAGMAFLVEHSPPNFHIVLASRVDPDLPLARLRSRGQLTEVRAADLRFTEDEAGRLLNGSMQLGLSGEDVAQLEASTEGWAGALQLAALSLEGRPERSAFIQAFSGTDRYVVDYLVEEVLRRQPADVRDFLLRTSILDRLSAPLCDALTGKANGRRLLDFVDRANLLVTPLDDRREWYRYHQLFADVLRAHLAEELPGDVPALHSRASEWYASNGEPDRAIRHALAAQDVQAAAALIELEAETVMRQHHPEKLIGWLADIPDETIRTMPVLATYYGHALQGVGDMEASAARLDEAERATKLPADEIHVVDRRSFAAVAARIAVGRGYLSMAAGDPDATVAHASKALELTPANEHHWRGTAVALLGLAHWIRGDLVAAESFHAEAVTSFEHAGGDTGLAVTSSYHHAELLKARGRLNAAEERLESSLRFVERQPGGMVRGAANLHIGLAEFCCERNDLNGAESHLEAAKRMGVYPPRTPWRWCQAQAHLHQSRRDWEAALGLLDEAERLQVRGSVPVYRPVAAWRARIWTAQRRVGEAWGWALARGLSVEDHLSYDREYEHITLARILLARAERDDIARAALLLERLLAAATAGGRTGTGIEIQVLLAVARHAEGRADAALEVLSTALVAAEPERYAEVFLGESTSIAPLLTASEERGVCPAYCRQLLGALSGAADETRPSAKVDALSDRELEVLRLLAGDLSGPDIASVLFVSLNTVRTHTKNVYAKLGVNGRRAAVSRAKELDLL